MADKVADIRKEIDALDNKVHDLLMERAELVLKIGAEKRKHNVQVIQPDREIIMIRRLLERHKGPLPRAAVVRIWRELVGAVSLLQTGIKVMVMADDNHEGLVMWDMAKDYFSSVLPMTRGSNPLGVLGAVREGEATLSVLPWPVDGDRAPWWRHLMDETGEKPMRIVARLPLGDHEKTPENRALAIGRLRFDPSGDDRSFIGLDLSGQDVSRARIVEKLKAIGLEPLGIFSSSTVHLVEVTGYAGPEDPRLKKIDLPITRIAALGGYPAPPKTGTE